MSRMREEAFELPKEELPGAEPFLLLEFVGAKAGEAASALLFREAVSACFKGFQGIVTAKGVPDFGSVKEISSSRLIF